VKEKSQKVKLIETYCQDLLKQQPLSKWAKSKKGINLMNTIARSMLIRHEWNIDDTIHGFSSNQGDSSFVLKLDLQRIEELFNFSFEQSSPFSYKKIPCEKCSKQIDARKLIGLKECGHRYCVSCYKVYLKESL
jgi:hypothetical protein